MGCRRGVSGFLPLVPGLRLTLVCLGLFAGDEKMYSAGAFIPPIIIPLVRPDGFADAINEAIIVLADAIRCLILPIEYFFNDGKLCPTLSSGCV